MPTFFIALASALLLAALVTEAVSRFWPGSYLALLIITFIALLVNGLFNARLRQNATTPASAEANKQERSRKPREDNQRNNKSANKKRADNRSDRGNSDRSTSDRGKKGGRSADAGRNSGRDKPAQSSTQQASETAPTGPQETGTVKWFNRSKGYGFIIRDNGDEIFVHQRSIINTGDRKQRPILRDGQKVSFVVAELEKGAQAEHVNGLD